MSELNFGLGRLPQQQPSLNRAFLMAADPAMQQEPPKPSRTWRLPPRKNQGSYPHCVGFSLRNLLDGAPLRTMRGPSPQDIYHAAQLIDEWAGEDYDGTSVLAGCKVLHKLGHISWYGWAYDVDTVRRWILIESPVILGIRWTQDMFTPEPKTGLIKPTGRTAGGHAIQTYRYDHRRGLFWLNQTWGNDWGINGLCCILGEHLDMLIREGGEAATIREQLAPREPKGNLPAPIATLFAPGHAVVEADLPGSGQTPGSTYPQ